MNQPQAGMTAQGVMAAQQQAQYNARNPAARLNRASSDASVCSYRPVNYSQHVVNPMMAQRYGSNLSINQAGLANAAEGKLVIIRSNRFSNFISRSIR